MKVRREYSLRSRDGPQIKGKTEGLSTEDVDRMALIADTFEPPQRSELREITMGLYSVPAGEPRQQRAVHATEITGFLYDEERQFDRFHWIRSGRPAHF